MGAHRGTQWHGVSLRGRERRGAKSAHATQRVPSGTVAHYEGEKGLERVVRFELPSAIGHCAFLNCYSLVRLTVPTAVTAIGFDAFALRSVVLRGKVVEFSYSLQLAYGLPVSACTDSTLFFRRL